MRQLAFKGLSPRPRGNPVVLRDLGRLRGPIPASAGEPFFGIAMSSPLRAYPRVRGGTASHRGHAQASRGLSPRPRGNLRASVHHLIRHGPIPASAGEPFPTALSIFALRAYPRVRGGTPEARRMRWIHEGLSPRPRGNLRVLRRRSHDDGPIPASAGEPLGRAMRSCGFGAYPRVRGGTVPAVAALDGPMGLSPRPRGNPELVKQAVAKTRAYPRVRGGTNPRAQLVDVREGLSPRPRGNRLLARE